MVTKTILSLTRYLSLANRHTVFIGPMVFYPIHKVNIPYNSHYSPFPHRRRFYIMRKPLEYGICCLFFLLSTLYVPSVTFKSK